MCGISDDSTRYRGNSENALHGTYHQASSQHRPHYLAEFCYYFNCRSGAMPAPTPCLCPTRCSSRLRAH
jgi:hypothetical protein